MLGGKGRWLTISFRSQNCSLPESNIRRKTKLRCPSLGISSCLSCLLPSSTVTNILPAFPLDPSQAHCVFQKPFLAALLGTLLWSSKCEYRSVRACPCVFAASCVPQRVCRRERDSLGHLISPPIFFEAESFIAHRSTGLRCVLSSR